MPRSFAVVAVVAAVSAAPAVAQDSRFAVGPQIGTTGIGAEVQFLASDRLVLRAGGDFLKVDEEFESDGIDYDGELDFSTGSVFVDLHPFANPFFVSAGAYFGGREVDLVAQSAGGSVEIGDQIFTAEQAGRIQGDLSFGDTAPFVGLGWNNTFRTEGRWGFKAVVGAAFGEDPEASLRRTGGVAIPAEVQTLLDAELRQEERELEEDADDFKVFPVLQVGLTYRF